MGGLGVGDAGAPEGSALSRSRLLAGGVAAAAGLSGLGAAAAPAAGAAAGSAFDLVFQVDHVGETMTAYGYLTHVAGLQPGSLFVGAAGDQTARGAHLTVHSVTRLTGRSILDTLRVIAVAGPLDLYYSPGAGA